MTQSIEITQNINTGWAIAAILDGKLVSAVSLEIGSAAEINMNTYKPAKDALHKTQSYIAAENKYWADEDADLQVFFGMISGGEFTYNFSKAEAKRAGLPKNFG